MSSNQKESYVGMWSNNKADGKGTYIVININKNLANLNENKITCIINYYVN